MKLSKQTLQVLRNFATINANLAITPGSTIQTITEAKTIMAEATVAENFDVPFGIYDLGQFIAVIEMMGDPDLSFGASAVTLTTANAKSMYRYAAASTLTTPTKKIVMPPITLSVTIPTVAIDQTRKAASVFGHSMISLEGDSGTISLVVLDPKSAGANTFGVILDEKHAYTESFQAHFLISNLKILPGEYLVEVSDKCISRWTNAASGVSYFIALEQTSKFTK